MYLNIYYHVCCILWHVIWQIAKLHRTIQMSTGYSHNTMCNWFLQGHVFWGNVLCGRGFLTRLSTYLKVKTKTTEGMYFRYVPTDFTYQMEKCVNHLTHMPIKLSTTSLFCPQEESPPASNFQVPYNKPMLIQTRFSITIQKKKPPGLASLPSHSVKAKVALLPRLLTIAIFHWEKSLEQETSYKSFLWC